MAKVVAWYQSSENGGVGEGSGGIESVINCSLLSCFDSDRDGIRSGPLGFLLHDCSTSLHVSDSKTSWSFLNSNRKACN